MLYTIHKQRIQKKTSLKVTSEKKFSVLVDKTTQSYLKMMSVIKQSIQTEPRSVQTDSEAALFGDIQQTWSECTMYGSYI